MLVFVRCFGYIKECLHWYVQYNFIGFERDEGDFTAIRSTAIYKCKLAPLHCVKLEENREKKIMQTCTHSNRRTF